MLAPEASVFPSLHYGELTFGLLALLSMNFFRDKPVSPLISSLSSDIKSYRWHFRIALGREIGCSQGESISLVFVNY